jgi:nitroimidazol reductase NimA-like FMN-containing flavoprotein (pyridoxamine 5'-phosphate oxidase superfamily)
MERNQVRRLPQRGHYDEQTIAEILDAGFLCHMAFTVEGQPFTIPTLYGREGRTLFLHGSAASRMMRQLATGIPACVSVAHVDGLVLARSAFHHSINYRSVVAFGTAHLIEEREAKLHALEVISDQVIRHRWQEVRAPNEKELKATSVLAMQIEDASAKIRMGGPVDDDVDLSLPIWAGVVPLLSVCGQPQPDDPATELAASVKQLLAGQR